MTVQRTAPTFLLRVLGKNSIPVSATAQATIEAVGAVKGHVSPYAVTVQAYANGTGTTLFKENQPGAYGTIDLPTTDNTTGGSCSGNTNKGTPSNISPELADKPAVGHAGRRRLPVGEIGRLAAVCEHRQPNPPGNGNMSQDLQSLGNGQYQVIPQTWDDSNGLPPRLMYIPIVDQLPSGNGTATILSFAWFYMTSATGGGSGTTINGQWVTMQLLATGQTSQYHPGVRGQVLAVELTG